MFFPVRGRLFPLWIWSGNVIPELPSADQGFDFFLELETLLYIMPIISVVPAVLVAVAPNSWPLHWLESLEDILILNIPPIHCQQGIGVEGATI